MTDPLDEGTLRRLIREELTALLAGFRLLPAIHKLSDREIAQRREAARRSREARANKRAVERAVETKNPVETKAKKRAVKRAAVTEPVVGIAHTETAAQPATTPKAAPKEAVTARVWLGYMAAYKLRYGTFPVRNAKVNGMLGHFVRRIPQDEAPHVAEFYVKHDSPLYVKAAHCVELMLRDAEKLRMEWATGRRPNGFDHGVGRMWWETWTGIKEVGERLKVEFDEQPQIYKARVFKAAAASGDLPPQVAEKLGV